MFEHWRKKQEEHGHWRRLKIPEFEGNEAYWWLIKQGERVLSLM